MVRSLIACAVVVMVAGTSAQAQPETQPAEATTRPMRPFERREGTPQRPWRERLGTYDPAATGAPLTQLEIDEVTHFMNTYSPRRMKRLEDVPDNRRDDIFRRIRGQYLALQRIKEEDRQIYELRLTRLPIEDEMFALGWQLKRDYDDGNGPRNVEELRSKLRQQVRLFVENRLEENRVRLKREQKRVEDAQAYLDQLMNNKEQLIEKGVTDIENERGNAFKELNMPMSGGGHRAFREGGDASGEAR